MRLGTTAKPGAQTLLSIMLGPDDTSIDATLRSARHPLVSDVSKTAC
jgi:hypothetical protein